MDPCLANCTKMRTAFSGSGLSAAGSSYTVTLRTSPYLEHSSPISAERSASTSPGPTMFFSRRTREGRPRNVTAFGAAPPPPPPPPPVAAAPPAGGGAGGGSCGTGGRALMPWRSSALTMMACTVTQTATRKATQTVTQTGTQKMATQAART